jgi:uncharacterized damage-inducible protein DinB
MNEPLANMLRYNRWANEQLFAFCRTLGDAQLDVCGAGASGTVRTLLVHITGGQQTLVLRTMGRQHEGELNRSSPWPGWDALLQALGDSNDALIAIAEPLDVDAEVDLPFMGKTYRFPKSFFLVHALEHAVEHRTEIKLTLGALGIETPDLDGWPWSADAGFGQEV